MNPRTVHLLLLGGGLATAVVSLLWTRRNRDRHAATEFGVFLGTVVLWAVAQLVEVVGGPRVAYGASFAVEAIRALMAVSWFYFTMTYAGYGSVIHSTTVRLCAAASTAYLLVFTAVPPVATAVTFDTVQLVDTPFTAVALGGATLPHNLARIVGYLLVGVGTVVLAYRLIKTEYTSAWQTVLFLSAVFTVVIFDSLIDQVLVPVAGVDYSVVGTSFVSAIYILTLYRGDRFESVPVARDHVFHNMNDGVVVVNAGHTIVDLNRAATSMLGDRVQTGSDARAVLPDEIATDDRVLNLTGGRTTVTIPENGTTRYYDMSISTLSPAAEPAGIAIILRDITEQKENERQLQRQNERLDQFASVVSHDLRSPLAVASGRVELARRECDSTHLKEASRAHDRMESLIDDVLLLAREGADIDTAEQVELERVVDECWRVVEAADATLIVETEGPIEADSSRLKQLLENLFRNALEHAGDDVTVTVGDLDHRTGFYVADDGPGIPADERDTVFDAGYSLADGGTGFGLKIVENVAEAHGWDVTVTDSEAGGARFEFGLPDSTGK